MEVKRTTKAKICAVLGLFIFVVACIKVDGFGTYAINKTSEIGNAGIDLLEKVIADSQSPSDNNEAMETKETSSSETSSSNNPDNVVTIPSTGTVDKEPDTSSKGIQEHNNAGIQVTVDKDTASDIYGKTLLFLFVVIVIIAIIIFIGKSRNIGSSFSLNN